MPTHLALDDALVEEAKRLGKHPSKRAAVTAALTEYVARRKRRRILNLFAKLPWDPKYEYKTERSRRG